MLFINAEQLLTNTLKNPFPRTGTDVIGVKTDVICLVTGNVIVLMTYTRKDHCC